MDESFYFADVCLLPSEQIGLHEQDSWEVSWVVAGSGVRRTGDTEEPIVAGEVVVVPPGVPHQWSFDVRGTSADGRVANVCLSFTQRLLDSVAATFPEMAEPVGSVSAIRQTVVLDEASAARVRQILSAMRSEEPPLRASSFLRLLAALASGGGRQVGDYRKQTDAERRMEQVRTYVVCNASRRMRVADVAAHVGMNRSAFCVFFRRMAGRTFIDYLNAYRLETACRMLRSTAMGVAEVCYAAGFNNVPYFNRVFRRAMGATPSEWRGEKGV